MGFLLALYDKSKYYRGSFPSRIHSLKEWLFCPMLGYLFLWIMNFNIPLSFCRKKKVSFLPCLNLKIPKSRFFSWRDFFLNKNFDNQGLSVLNFLHEIRYPREHVEIYPWFMYCTYGQEPTFLMLILRQSQICIAKY